MITVTECARARGILEGDGTRTHQEIAMSPRTLAHYIARKRALRFA